MPSYSGNQPLEDTMTRTYDADNSGALFDHIKTKKKLKRDGDLAELLGEHRSVISEIRHGKRQVNSDLLVRICDRTGMSLKSAKAMIAKEVA
jgi:transcriptional regulator with XRE-family HTH domain